MLGKNLSLTVNKQKPKGNYSLLDSEKFHTYKNHFFKKKIDYILHFLAEKAIMYCIAFIPIIV